MCLDPISLCYRYSVPGEVLQSVRTVYSPICEKDSVVSATDSPILATGIRIRSTVETIEDVHLGNPASIAKQTESSETSNTAAETTSYSGGRS